MESSQNSFGEQLCQTDFQYRLQFFVRFETVSSNDLQWALKFELNFRNQFGWKF